MTTCKQSILELTKRWSSILEVDKIPDKQFSASLHLSHTPYMASEIISITHSLVFNVYLVYFIVLLGNSYLS